MTQNELASYQYNNRGLISQTTQRLIYGNAATDAAAQPITSTVSTDALGRITAFGSQAYQYDANGNRTQKATIAPAGIETTAPLNATYTHNRSTPSNGDTLNTAGDLTQDAWRSFTTDAAGRMAHWQQTGPIPCSTPLCPKAYTLGTLSQQHVHNGQNQRLVKVSSQTIATSAIKPAQTMRTTSAYLYGSAGYEILSEVTRSTQNGLENATQRTEHIYLPTPSGPMPVAAIISQARQAMNNLPADTATRIVAVHSDHLNTPRRITQADGKIIWQWQISATGDIAPTVHTSNPMSVQLIDNAVGYNLRYPGQIDDGSGLFYNLNRYYNPSTGRYTQADPIGLAGGMNRFVYANNNALQYVDPWGLAWQDAYASFMITPENASNAAEYWATRQNETGSMLYAIPGMTAALVANHYDSVLGAVCSIKGGGKGTPFTKGGPLRDPKTSNYLPHPNAEGPHTTLGTRSGRNGEYTQGTTFDRNGNFLGRTDVTNHGRGDHTNPHWHPAVGPNSVGSGQAIPK